MPESTLTDRFQTTIPAEVRRALNLKPRQKLIYEVRGDSVTVRAAEGSLADLKGILRPAAPRAGGEADETDGRAAWAEAAVARYRRSRR